MSRRVSYRVSNDSPRNPFSASVCLCSTWLYYRHSLTKAFSISNPLHILLVEGTICVNIFTWDIFVSSFFVMPPGCVLCIKCSCMCN